MKFGQYLETLMDERMLTTVELARRITKTRGIPISRTYIGSVMKARRRIPLPEIPTTYKDPKRMKKFLTMPQVVAALNDVKRLSKKEEETLMGFAYAQAVGADAGNLSSIQQKQLETILGAKEAVLVNSKDYQLPPKITWKRLTASPYPKSKVSVSLKDKSTIVVNPKARVRANDYVVMIRNGKASLERLGKKIPQSAKLMRVEAQFF